MFSRVEGQAWSHAKRRDNIKKEKGLARSIFFYWGLIGKSTPLKFDVILVIALSYKISI